MKETLIIEDCADDLVLFKAAVGKQLGKYVCCMDGITAINLFSANFERFDSIIVDLGLPGMSGLEVIRKIRTISKEVSIFVLTGLEDPILRREAILAGATSFSRKPCLLEDYQMLVNQVLAIKTSYNRGKSIMKNWRTTTLGCLAAVAGIVAIADFGPLATKIANCIVSSCAGVGLVLAREQKTHEKENGNS